MCPDRSPFLGNTRGSKQAVKATQGRLRQDRVLWFPELEQRVTGSDREFLHGGFDLLFQPIHGFNRAAPAEVIDGRYSVPWQRFDADQLHDRASYRADHDWIQRAESRFPFCLD